MAALQLGGQLREGVHAQVELQHDARVRVEGAEQLGRVGVRRAGLRLQRVELLLVLLPVEECFDALRVARLHPHVAVQVALGLGFLQVDFRV